MVAFKGRDWREAGKKISFTTATRKRYGGRFETVYTRKGLPFRAWKRQMPTIARDILDCVIYLYPSEAGAVKGVDAGGTGFLVGIPARHDGQQWEHLYAVTNAHVVGAGEDEGRSPVIRLNTLQGDMDVYPSDFDSWIPHPKGADLAVHYFGLVNRGSFHYKSINPDMFITKGELERLKVGPGGDVFMVGRFVALEGRQKNTPSVRFGNISMMPDEPVPHHSGIAQESFIVEMRSYSGYSGSPVFLHFPYPAERRTSAIDWYLPRLEDEYLADDLTRYAALLAGDGKPHVTAFSDAYLFGVDWGHLPYYEPVYQEVKEGGRTKLRKVAEVVTKAHSGQAGVVPAWVLRDFLFSEGFKDMRKEADEDVKKRQEDSRFVLDVKKPDERPFDKEAFEEALRRASRKTDTEGEHGEK